MPPRCPPQPESARRQFGDDARVRASRSARRRRTCTRFAARRSSSRSAAKSSPTTSSSASSTISTCCTASASGSSSSHGCRPQVEAILAAQGIPSRYAHGVRVTDADAMDCVLEAAGPGARAHRGAALARPRQLADGRRAQPRVDAATTSPPSRWACVDGVDMQLTGEVRRVDTEAIQQRLDDGDIVLISPIGYSPTGEIFNLTRRGSGDAGRGAARGARSSSSSWTPTACATAGGSS